MNKFNLEINLSTMALWACLLCVTWFGHFNNWWPINFPITFTAIVSTLYGITLIAQIIIAIINRNN